VAFWMAHLYPKLVEKVVFVASGIHATPTSQKPLLAEFDYDHIAELLVPTTVTGLRNFASVAMHKRVHRLPKFVCRDVLDVSSDGTGIRLFWLRSNLLRNRLLGLRIEAGQ
jgi:pimeloyl-ACP methyl ester carboxylesterase